MAAVDKTLLKRLGGMPTLQRVHKTFYDKVYAHPWLRPYFTDKPQKLLEDQQTDFLAMLMGGGYVYQGKTPKVAHQHMVITEELFDLRHSMLKESLEEEGVEEGMRREWLAVDSSLKDALVKNSVTECKRSNPGQMFLDFPKPAHM